MVKTKWQRLQEREGTTEEEKEPRKKTKVPFTADEDDRLSKLVAPYLEAMSTIKYASFVSQFPGRSNRELQMQVDSSLNRLKMQRAASKRKREQEGLETPRQP